MIHKITLSGYSATTDDISGVLILGTYDSYGIERIQLELGPEWNALVIKATFNPPTGSEPVTVVADTSGQLRVPQEATSSAGQGAITFVGTAAGLQRISTDLPYIVKTHSQIEGATPSPTPSEWEQFVAQVQQARDDAEAAAQAAEDSQTAAAGSASDAADSAKAAAGSAEEAEKLVTGAVTAITTARDEAVRAVNTAGGNAVQAVNTAGNSALQGIEQKKTEAVQAVEDARDAGVRAVENAQTTGVQAVQTAQTTAVGAVNAAGDAKIEQIEQINALLPTPTEEDAGKVPTVNDAGTGYELRSTLEKNISDYYAMRRTGKVYQTRLWKFVANPTSAGEKLLDNAGLVFEPSTDTEEGPDDYLNGQNPLFEWVNVNYIRDDDGAPRPTAIEGQAGFKTSGAVDVGTMQMSFWYKIDASGEDYIDYYVSDTPHPELGLGPWPECVKADGTVLPWCIGSKDISGEASDGLPRSQPGLKPIRNVSHNLIITACQQKGPGYWGAGAVRNTFQILFNAIKGATKSSQALYAGCTNYNYQYEAAVQSEDAHTYFPVTNAQAANLVVGSYVSVGYGSNNNGAVNQDRGQASVHAYADDVKILSIETLDDNNMAVYLDIPEESAFNTMPHVYTETLSAPIILSTMPWWSGATDAVKGRHDGSPGSNTNGKYPYRVQGREYAVGGYLVASDTVVRLNEDGTRTVYAAPRGTAHSANTETIQSTYRQIGTIPLNSSGSVADYWVGDAGIDEDTGVWYPSAQGGGSTQGCADMCYCGGDAANSFREYLQCGSLGSGARAGSCCLDLGNGLGGGYWAYLAGD